MPRSAVSGRYGAAVGESAFAGDDRELLPPGVDSRVIGGLDRASRPFAWSPRRASDPCQGSTCRVSRRLGPGESTLCEVVSSGAGERPRQRSTRQVHRWHEPGEPTLCVAGLVRRWRTTPAGGRRAGRTSGLGRASRPFGSWAGLLRSASRLPESFGAWSRVSSLPGWAHSIAGRAGRSLPESNSSGRPTRRGRVDLLVVVSSGGRDRPRQRPTRRACRWPGPGESAVRDD